jgi:hypothetical protein
MRSIVCAALLLTVPVQAGARDAETASPEQGMRSPASGTMDVSSCAMSQQGGEAVLSATIVTGAGPGGGPHVKRQGVGVVEADNIDGDHAGMDFSWSWGQSNSGSASSSGSAGRIVPTVTAHAIKTKGAGGVDRVGRQLCAAPPAGQRLLLPAVQKREAKPVATCDVSGDAATPTFMIRMPLSAFGADAKTGHVSLIRREASTPSVSERRTSTDDIEWTVIAGCATDAKGRASYDLAVGKKV